MKTPTIILIGTVAIIIALVLGYVVFVKPKSGEQVQNPEVNNNTADTTLTPDDTSIPIPAPDDDNSEIDTADWKIYRNDKYGYEIKYPLTWFIYDDYYNREKHPENLYIQNFLRPKKGGFSGIGGTGCQLNIWVENDKYVSIQKWIDVQKNNIGKDLEKTFIKKVEIGKIKASEITFFGSFEGSNKPFIVMQKNEVIYKVSQSWQDVDQENCQPIFNNMILTFNFIN